MAAVTAEAATIGGAAATGGAIKRAAVTVGMIGEAAIDGLLPHADRKGAVLIQSQGATRSAQNRDRGKTRLLYSLLSKSA
jgi:hypothetical protein